MVDRTFVNEVFERLVKQDRLKKMLKLSFRFKKQNDMENRFLSLRNSNNICPIQKINILLYIIKKTYIEYYRNRWKEKQNE